MRKTFLSVSAALLTFLLAIVLWQQSYEPKGAVASSEEETEEHDEYDGPWERNELEFEKTKDPATGRVPIERLWNAINYTEELKSQNNYRSLSMLWQERGPIFDVVGPSNGNSRGQVSGQAANTYTSGRIRAVLVDKADPTGNTVLAGGVAGGLFKCTNFLSTTPNWAPVNDFFSNMAISYMCQDPNNPAIMYFTTGEPTNNSDAVLGNGIWKSTNGGTTWTQLSSTTNAATGNLFRQAFRILVDNSGNVYVALRGNGLRRSTDGGTTWTNITPSGVFASCTDIELSSTGRLHASFGYNTGNGSNAANYRYTDNPATATSSSGWNSGTGLPSGVNEGNRMELACLGSTVYAAYTNGGATSSTRNHVYAIYRSIDGGVNWTRQNLTDYTTAISNSQGWYNISLAINPTNVNEVIVGGLDAYRSLDGAVTMTRMTYWVSTAPYVHADHHDAQYHIVGGETRILMATDGGLFLSRDAGLTFADKNRNFGIKQFYSAVMHPNASTHPNYILGGTQDNGTHQLNAAGLTSSVEVTGGDGAFTDIHESNPNVQWGAYVYNRYRLSVNGGSSWTAVNWTSSGADFGLFINPFVYDGTTDILYATGRSNELHRVSNASNTAIDVSEFIPLTSLGTIGTLKLSPYTPNRIFLGGTSGRLYRVDNANTIPSGAPADGNVTELANPWGSAYVSCVAVGTSDNHLIVTVSNYGVNNVYYSSNGGTSWSAVDGTGTNSLPDMPVRWAIFPPGDNTKAIIATEAGVYTTSLINGTSTQWFPSNGFPTVRTDMIRLRASDNTIVAATHARGIYTGNLLSILPLRNINLSATVQADGSAALKWNPTDASNAAKYRVQYSTDGIRFTQVAEVSHPNVQFKHQPTVAVGYYRIMGVEPNQAPVFSNIVTVRSNRSVKGLQVKVSPNPLTSTGTFEISGADGEYSWQMIAIDGRIIQSGRNKLAPGSRIIYPVNTAGLAPGMYTFRVSTAKETVTAAFIKQ